MSTDNKLKVTHISFISPVPVTILYIHLDIFTLMWGGGGGDVGRLSIEQAHFKNISVQEQWWNLHLSTVEFRESFRYSNKKKYMCVLIKCVIICVKPN